jgi:hypothetical protein
VLPRAAGVGVGVQDDMRDASLQQEVRRGEPRLSGTDDD